MNDPVNMVPVMEKQSIVDKKGGTIVTVSLF